MCVLLVRSLQVTATEMEQLADCNEKLLLMRQPTNKLKYRRSDNITCEYNISKSNLAHLDYNFIVILCVDMHHAHRM